MIHSLTIKFKGIASPNKHLAKIHAGTLVPDLFGFSSSKGEQRLFSVKVIKIAWASEYYHARSHLDCSLWVIPKVFIYILQLDTELVELRDFVDTNYEYHSTARPVLISIIL
jgi:hypothetical protein